MWERFTFSSLAMAERERICTAAPHSQGCLEITGQLSGPGGELTGRDAVDTLMHVLYARLLARHSAAV